MGAQNGRAHSLGSLLACNRSREKCCALLAHRAGPQATALCARPTPSMSRVASVIFSFACAQEGMRGAGCDGPVAAVRHAADATLRAASTHHEQQRRCQHALHYLGAKAAVVARQACGGDDSERAQWERQRGAREGGRDKRRAGRLQQGAASTAVGRRPTPPPLTFIPHDLRCRRQHAAVVRSRIAAAGRVPAAAGPPHSVIAGSSDGMPGAA